MRTQKRTRKFLPLWKNERPWLMYREETKLMFCTYSYCEDQGENGSFVSRCNNFRVDALNAHVGKGNFSSDLEEKNHIFDKYFTLPDTFRMQGLRFNFPNFSCVCLEGSD